MSPKLTHFYLSFLLLLLIQPFIAQSRRLQSSYHSSNFLQNLKGSQKGETVKGLKNLKQYLKRFGYYPNDQNDINLTNDFDEILEDALKTYQKIYGLKVTGNLDPDTVKLMSTPRCGMPDDHIIKSNNNSSEIHIVPHYAFFDGNPKWPSSKYHLTYTFRSGVQPIDLQEQRSACSRAFQTWASVTKFTFEEVPETSQPDLVLGFYRGDHGDGLAFDGRWNTLAHAYAPTDGRLHFDADETWSSSNSISSSQVDLETVAVHEIGHLLGLQHSTDQTAVMFAVIPYGSINRDLNQDDIDGIHALYAN